MGSPLWLFKHYLRQTDITADDLYGNGQADLLANHGTDALYQSERVLLALISLFSALHQAKAPGSQMPALFWGLRLPNAPKCPVVNAPKCPATP
eukprot:4062868-Amphidinium_carterae.1